MGLLVWAMAVRILNALLVQTSFVPDEYWQSLEVAHRTVFGYGALTWEWTLALRSSLHPLLFAPGFLALKFFNIDTAFSLNLSARMLQTCIAFAGDVFLFRATHRLFGRKIAHYAVLCQLLSWFHFYTCVRTLVNSLEASLLPLVLAYWPLLAKDHPPWPAQLCSILAACAMCLFRPPSTVFIAILALLTLRRSLSLMCAAALVGLTTLLVFAVADRCFYGFWVLPALNFLRYNILEDIASAYGVHPLHWYLTAGLWTVAPTMFPLALIGAWQRRAAWSAPVPLAAAGYLLALSLTPHKELRFLQGLLPLVHMLAGAALASLPTARRRVTPRAVLALLACINIPLALYFGMVHQRGPLDAMAHLARDLAPAKNGSAPRPYVLLLTPCHATPLYSHLHVNVTVRFLHCETITALRNASEEADLFFSAPMLWLARHAQDSLPTHLVFFDSLFTVIHPWLEEHNFTKAASFFHSHFPERWTGNTIDAYKHF